MPQAARVSVPGARLSIPSDRAAYQASQSLYGTLKDGRGLLEEACKMLRVAEDQARKIHILVDRDATKTCVGQLLESVKMATHAQGRLLGEFAVFDVPSRETEPLVSLTDDLRTMFGRADAALTRARIMVDDDRLFPSQTSSAPSAQQPPPDETTATEKARLRTMDPSHNIQYRDVSAEVEARLVAKAEQKMEKARLRQLKRKRRSTVSVPDVDRLDIEDQAGPVRSQPGRNNKRLRTEEVTSKPQEAVEPDQTLAAHKKRRRKQRSSDGAAAGDDTAPNKRLKT